MDHPQCGPHTDTGSWCKDHPLTRSFLWLDMVFFISVNIDFSIYPHTTVVVFGGKLKCDCYQWVNYIYLIFFWDIILRTTIRNVFNRIIVANIVAHNKIASFHCSSFQKLGMVLAVAHPGSMHWFMFRPV